jgi:hypothetical protein
MRWRWVGNVSLNCEAELLVMCDWVRGIQNGLPEQSLNYFLILAGDSNCSRGVETAPLAQSPRSCSPFAHHLLTIAHLLPPSPYPFPPPSHLTHLHLTLTHLWLTQILPIKQPCSPFRTETDFLHVRIDLITRCTLRRHFPLFASNAVSQRRRSAVNGRYD